MSELRAVWGGVGNFGEKYWDGRKQERSNKCLSWSADCSQLNFVSGAMEADIGQDAEFAGGMRGSKKKKRAFYWNGRETVCVLC